MKKKITMLVACAASLVLEILPYGAVLNIADPDGEAQRKTFSYFSLVPYGYANFGPFLTAVLTCIILILAVIMLFKSSKGFNTAYKVLSVAACVTSLMPLMLGTRCFSVIGAVISVIIIAQTIIAFTEKKKDE